MCSAESGSAPQGCCLQVVLLGAKPCRILWEQILACTTFFPVGYFTAGSVWVSSVHTSLPQHVLWRVFRLFCFD